MSAGLRDAVLRTLQNAIVVVAGIALLWIADGGLERDAAHRTPASPNPYDTTVDVPVTAGPVGRLHARLQISFGPDLQNEDVAHLLHQVKNLAAHLFALRRGNEHGAPMCYFVTPVA